MPELSGRRTLWGLTIVLWAALGMGSGRADVPAGRPEVLVFAAASLAGPLEAIAGQFSAREGIYVRISFGASSTLAKQIEAGAPADLYISADQDWMNFLDQRNLIRADSRVNLLSNNLVLISPAANAAPIDPVPGFDLKARLGRGKLALADPESVPAGRYAKAALERLGVWPQVAGQLAPAENVRAALAYVARGACPVGIVYASDAAAEKNVRVIAEISPDLYPPIAYPAALTRSARPGTERLLAFLQSDEAINRFLSAGFRRPDLPDADPTSTQPQTSDPRRM